MAQIPNHSRPAAFRHGFPFLSAAALPPALPALLAQLLALLSPLPMAALWHKARGEMRPGSIPVGNSFTVRGVTPEHSLELSDFGGSVLHLWRR